MDKLRCIEVFIEVARYGSFAAAATKLNMSRASVSKHIASLEHEFKVSILNRNARKVVLTDTGAEILERCQTLLRSYEVLVRDIQDAKNEISGTIRVEAPPIFGARFLLPQIAEFSKTHPGIHVDLSLSDPSQDFRAKGADLFVGFNHITDDSCTTVNLLRFPQVIVAAPSYLAQHSSPSCPEELQNLNCMIHTQKASDSMWRFANGSAVSLHGTIRSNYGEAIKQATLLGHGISMFPYYFVQRECEAGDLEILLPAFPPAWLQFSAVYETNRVIPLRMKRFIQSLEVWSASESFPAPKIRESEHLSAPG